MKRLVIAIIVIALLVVAAYVVMQQTSAQAQAGPDSAQEAEPAETLAPVLAASEIVADAVVVPVRSAELSLPAGGIVAEVLVAEGDSVEAGQVLLRLDDGRQAAGLARAAAQLAASEARLAELQAGARQEEVAAAEAALEAAEARLNRIENGPLPQEVASAQGALAEARAELQRVLEGPDQPELVAAEAEVANAAASVRQAQAAYDRVAGDPDLWKRPEPAQLEQATNNYTVAQARLEDLRIGAGAGEIAAARARVQQAQAKLDLLTAVNPADRAAAAAEVRQLQAQLDLQRAGSRPEAIAAAEADAAASRAALAEAQAALAETELRAPFAGTVARLDGEVGEQVAPGNTVVWLADLSAWRIETDDLTELSIVRISEGDPVLVTFDAIPDLKLTGAVLRSRAVGETKLGDVTYTVVIQPDRHDTRLRWNMTATVVVMPE